MTRPIRLLLLSLLAMLALGSMAATSASADEFVIEGKEVTESTNIEGTSGLSLLSTTIAGVKVEIDCTSDTFTGTIQAGGSGLVTLLLKKCTMTKPVKCSVPETIEGKLKDKLIGTTTPEEEFEGDSGETISEIPVTGAECLVKGTYKLTGTQKCELPKALEELVEHEIVCTKAGSKLILAGNAATFSSTEKAKLVSGKKWSVVDVQAPRPELVDFRSNQKVLIDHRNKTAYGGLESALGITEYGEKNEVEWESGKVGEIKKIWPVAYVLGETVKLLARFAVEGPTREFLEKNAEEIELIGETAVAGGSFNFKLKLTNAQIKTQFAGHSGYLATEVIEGSTALVKKVAKSLATINWRWVVKETGRPNTIQQALGTNMNTYYLLFKTPVTGVFIYFTLLDLATLNIEKETGTLEEKKVISGVYLGFSNKQKEASCLTLECGILRIRTFNPANGEITRDGNPLLYYENIKTGLNLTQYRASSEFKNSAARGRFEAILLLKGLVGECGAWARAFRIALTTEGVTSVQLRIFPQYPSTPVGLLCQAEGECDFIVKTWGFTGNGTGLLTLFPYLQSELTDENGATGQGVENPHSWFSNHQIVEVGNKLYDPSYGTPSVGVGNAGETNLNLLLYQEKNISGFCPDHGVIGEVNCAKAVAGQLRTGKAVETGALKGEEELTETVKQQEPE